MPYNDGIHVYLMIEGTMSHKAHLKPGSIVTCRSDIDELTIWKSYHCDINDDVDLVTRNDIVVVLGFRSTPKKELQDNANVLTDEWRPGAYKVLTPRGRVGWIGAGWIVSAET